MKIFIASFNRSSSGAIQHLVKKMQEKKWITTSPKCADYILAVGDRSEEFDFVLEQFRQNKKIIHLWAGEMSGGTHDEVYRHSITMMSMLQLCTNFKAKERVQFLLDDVGMTSHAHVVGNVMLDDMKTNDSVVPKEKYDLVLYNPSTLYGEDEVLDDLGEIQGIIEGKNHIWIAPNGDKFSDIIEPFVTHKSLPRPQFLGLIKGCDRFITNSSCQYYEAPFLMNKDNIISIGKRNTERESKYADMSGEQATKNIIKILETVG